MPFAPPSVFHFPMRIASAPGGIGLSKTFCQAYPSARATCSAVSSVISAGTSTPSSSDSAEKCSLALAKSSFAAAVYFAFTRPASARWMSICSLT